MSPQRIARNVLGRLAPYPVKAGYRARRYRRGRNNVTVLLNDAALRARWLKATPDTYRVGQEHRQPEVRSYDLIENDSGVHPILGHGADRIQIRRAVDALTLTGDDLAVVGPTSRPPLMGRSGFEPSVAPTAIAISRERYEEVGGAPEGNDLAGLHDRARDAGARITLIPIPSGGVVPGRRKDPVRAPAVVMLSAVPMHDVGGGSRGGQIARELVRSGCQVTFVSIFNSYEPVDLGLRFVHPGLEQVRVEDFDPIALADRVLAPGWVLVEIPSPETVRPVSELRSRGWRLCYDVIDRWSDPGLGGDWYRSDIEAGLLRSADLVVASSPDLVGYAAEGGVDATLIPNAVDTELFGPEPGATPSDLPSGTGPVIGHHGSLYGDWIDWAAIEAVAEAWPEARVVMIGDVAKGHPPLPPNVSFLGLKAQSDLPDYLRRFQVGLVPFVVSETTHTVSPLKVFEYLASGVAVAAPPLRALRDLEGVYTAESLVDAVDLALEAPRPDPARVRIEHSWESRVTELLAVLRLEPPALQVTRVRRLTRPVVHYLPAERILD